MRISSKLSLLLAAASTHVSAQTTTTSSAASASTGDRETGKLGDAPEVIDNPVGVVYKAILPESAFFKPAYPEGGNIKGEVTAVANDDGLGVRFTIKLSNLPKIGAPLPYHIHVNDVPDNGNCTATGAHLDPYLRGEAPPCDASAPETCQVGDLSGKHGDIPTDQDAWETSYVDLYASTVEGYEGFFGNRSIVFHYPNKTRITCANFEKVEGGAELPDPSSISSTATSSAGTGGSATGSFATSTPTQGTGSVAPSFTATITGGVSTTSRPSPTGTSSVVTAAASGLRASVASVAMVGVAVLLML